MATVPVSNLETLPGSPSTPGGAELLNLFRCCVSGASRQLRGTTGLSMVSVKGIGAKEAGGHQVAYEAGCFSDTAQATQACLA